MTWKKLGLVALIIAILFAIPFSRKAMLFILPLGKGVDDIVMSVALVISIVIWGGRICKDLKRDTDRLLSDETYFARTRIVFFAIVGAAVVIVLLASWITLSTITQ